MIFVLNRENLKESLIIMVLILSLLFTLKTNVKTAIEATQSVVTRTDVSLARLKTLVVLRLAQGTGKTLAGRRGDGHGGTFAGILRLTADTKLARELAA